MTEKSQQLEKLILEIIQTRKQRVFYVESYLTLFDESDILLAFENLKNQINADIEYEVFCENCHLSYTGNKQLETYFCEVCRPKRKIKEPKVRIRLRILSKD